MGSFLSKNHGICTEEISCGSRCNTFHSEVIGQTTFTMPQDIGKSIKCLTAMIVRLKCYSVLKLDVLASKNFPM